MSSWNYLCLVLAVLLSAPPPSEAFVRLRHLHTVYLPSAYEPEIKHVFADGVAEQLTFDKNSPISYIVGKNIIHIIDYSTPGELKNIGHLTINQPGEFTDIEACGNWLAVAFDNQANPLQGKVFIYNTLEALEGKLSEKHDIIVGPVPDMLKWTKDCRTVVVAIEGQLVELSAGQFVDPEGAVVFVNFPNNDPEGGPYQIRVANFTKFNKVEELYVKKGVRRIYHGEGSGLPVTFSQDLEPEYIDFNDDETIAYVVLQEANAVAAVDIQTASVMELYPLGEVKHNRVRSGLDASDKDNGINISRWDISGIRQPDAIKYIKISDTPYIISANEGDSKEYKFKSANWKFDESQRGNKMVLDAADSVNVLLKAALADDKQLGRLQFSKVDGLLPNGKYERFCSYGSRGFTVFNAADFTEVWDSGDQLEREIKRYYPYAFNSNPGDEKDTVDESKDSRSDNKGPEPESLETGELPNGQKVLFVGLERPGFIAIYTLGEKRPGLLDVKFQSLHYAGGGDFSRSHTWETLWDQRISRDLDPEDMKFITAKDSPTGQPLLGVVGTVSGTFSMYEVYDDGLHVEVVSNKGSKLHICCHMWVLLLCFLALQLARR